MTRAMLSIAKPGKWIALYRGPHGTWRTANDARGWPIYCDSKELAESVAAYRIKRLETWT